jgi:uncharacterized protein DUF3800
MEAYFDESGDFGPAPTGKEKYSFVMGIVIPETSAASLKIDFDWFESELDSKEYVHGEAKGVLLSLEHRKVLLEILKAHRDVMLVPVTLNLGYSDKDFLHSAPENIRKLIEKNLEQDSASMTVPQRKELARRFSNLSAPVLARIAAYAITILRTIEAIGLYYHCQKFYELYDPIKMIFDRVVKPEGREELVFKEALFGWLTNWSSDLPLRTAPAIDLSHPLGVLYGEERQGRFAFDLKKMLRGKIEYADSKDVWQIRLADFVVSIWAQSILDHDGKSGHQPLFREINRKTVLDGSHLLGFVGLTEQTAPVAAPAWVEVFHRIAVGDVKILPCD